MLVVLRPNLMSSIVIVCASSFQNIMQPFPRLISMIDYSKTLSKPNTKSVMLLYIVQNDVILLNIPNIKDVYFQKLWNTYNLSNVSLLMSFFDILRISNKAILFLL